MKKRIRIEIILSVLWLVFMSWQLTVTEDIATADNHDDWIVSLPLVARSQISGTVYYVSTSGDDNSSGTLQRPFRTIRKGIKTAQPGDAVVVRSGTYVERLIISNSGTAQRPILITAYPGEHPIIDGNDQLPGGNEFAPLVRVAGNHVTFSGFEIRNSTARGIAVPEASYVHLRDLNVHHNWKGGIHIEKASHVTLENSLVWQNIQARKEANVRGDSGVAFVQTNDSVARHLQVYQNYGEGLVAGRKTDHITLENNIVWDNLHANLYLVDSQFPLVQRNLVYCTADREFWRSPNGTPRAGNGLISNDELFEIDPDIPVGNGQVIVNNLVVGCGLNLAIFTQQADGGLKNALIANNTFVEAQGDPGSDFANMVFADGIYENSLVTNNLMLQTEGTLIRGNIDDDPSIVFNHNLYSKSVPSEFRGPNDFVGNPLLVNADAVLAGGQVDPGWYKLGIMSPAIDKASSLPEVWDDYFGNSRTGKPDIGAHEISDEALALRNDMTRRLGENNDASNVRLPIPLSNLAMIGIVLILLAGLTLIPARR